VYVSGHEMVADDEEDVNTKKAIRKSARIVVVKHDKEYRRYS
jgi:hypothetical protein